MPLRLRSTRARSPPTDVALVGARDLDPAEQAFVAEHGIDDDLERALAGTDAVYVALDVDVLEPGKVSRFMPVPGGLDARARSSPSCSTSPSGAGSRGSA